MKRLGSSDSLGALMSICPNSTDQHDQGNNAMYTRSFQTMMDGYDEENCIDQGSCQLVGSEKKRRLSLDQVKALEKNFEVENKLEPERKVKLAQELGLQPRQVAVWFQNRRARWKTKQLERDYGLLKANYDGLKLNINKLQHDNEALMKEIRELKSKIKEDGNDSNSKLSVKDEGLRSDSGENPKPETPINFQLPKTDEDSTFASKNEIILGEPSAAFVDFKDGSSDSDSSAILNDENIANRNNDTNIPTGGAIINHSSAHDHRFLEIDQNINNFQFEEYKAFSAKNILGDHGHKQFVKIEEHNFFGEESCSTLFSDDQPPSLHWYEWN